MPELPEVETTRCGILPHTQHQTIINIIVREYRLRWPIPPEIQKILTGKTILDIERRGKYLLLKTHDGTLLIHLGMSGRLRILQADFPAKKHDHVDVIFSNQLLLRFTDPRRFGAFLWLEGNPHEHALLKNLGVEPLTRHCNGMYLWTKAQNKTIPIKSFLMDSKIVTGIGNIYASEALFAAGIHPALPAKSLPLDAYLRLAKSIKKILRHAIQCGGTTLKDFVNSEGKPGYFVTQLNVYGRANQPCKQCTTVLQPMKIGQRSTVYCEKCQCRKLA